MPLSKNGLGVAPEVQTGYFLFGIFFFRTSERKSTTKLSFTQVFQVLKVRTADCRQASFGDVKIQYFWAFVKSPGGFTGTL